MENYIDLQSKQLIFPKIQQGIFSSKLYKVIIDFKLLFYYYKTFIYITQVYLIVITIHLIMNK